MNNDGNFSIINYFSKGLTWDIFLQGFFILNAIIIGASLLFYVSASYHKKDQGFLEFYSGKIIGSILQFYKLPAETAGNDLIQKLASLTQFFAVSTVFIVLSFTAGVISNHVSDAFMDQDNIAHLGLKKLWAPINESEGYRNTDKTIKLATFNKIFDFQNIAVTDSSGKILTPLTDEEKLQIYYEAKHEILATKDWKDYLAYSQNLVNLTQSFAFASWLLIIFSGLGIFFSVTTSEKREYYFSNKLFKSIEVWWLLSLVIIMVFNLILPTLLSIYYTKILMLGITLLSIGGLFSKTLQGHRLGTSIFALIISSYAYILASVAWKNAEKETCAKTYGLLKYFNNIQHTNKEMIKFKTYLQKR